MHTHHRSHIVALEEEKTIGAPVGAAGGIVSSLQVFWNGERLSGYLLGDGRR